MEATSTILNAVLPAGWTSLTELSRTLGVHPSTVFRWAGKGVRGRRLGTTKIGGRTGVTPADLQRFVDDLSRPAGARWISDDSAPSGSRGVREDCGRA